MNGKYSQRRPDHAKQSVTDALKTSSKRGIQKKQKQMVIWLVINLLVKLLVFQKNSQQKNSEVVTNEHDKNT